MRIAVLDDDPGIIKTIGPLIESEFDCEVGLFQSPHRFLEFFENNPVDVLLTDLRMPGKSGMDILKEVKSSSPETVILLFSAYASVEGAIEAMKAGAFDFLTKPVEGEELIFRLRRAVEYRTRLKRLEEKESPTRLVYSSEKMKRLIHLARRAAAKDVTILIEGPTGAGKEMVARYIHRHSPRKNKPFVAINCGAIPETLIESELFGYRKGAFTGATTDREGKFQAADGGTLFLDEVSELSLEAQVKLLRVLQERSVRRLGSSGEEPIDVRVISASNRPLAELVKQGSFREDLFYRLAVLVLEVPPLSERKEDIPVLAEEILNREYYGSRLDRSALEKLENYDWPGNVRELENVLVRALILADSDTITAEHIEFHSGNSALEKGEPFQLPPDGVDLEKLERDLLFQALERAGGNKTRAAQLLGLSRPTLIYRLKKYS